MSTEDNKALMRKSFEEVWNRRNLAFADESMGPNYVMHYPTGPVYGIEGAKHWASTWLTAYPDIRFAIEDLVAEGDKVVVRWSGRGTHQGPLEGIPVTGKQVTFTGIFITRFEGGKGVETWAEFNGLESMQQAGCHPRRASQLVTSSPFSR